MNAATLLRSAGRALRLAVARSMALWMALAVLALPLSALAGSAAAVPAVPAVALPAPAASAPTPARDAASGRYGYRDAAGQWVIAAQFEDANPFSSGLAFVQNPDGSSGLIDRAGQLVLPHVQPAVWHSETLMTEAGFSDGLLACRDTNSGKVGFVDTKGRWVIEPRFADAFEFHEGLAAFRLREGAKVGFIDRQGRVVIAAKFGTNFRAPPVFSEGLAAVGLNDDWPRTNLDPPGRLGYIDRSGRWVLQPRFSSGSNFVNGRATATVGERELVLQHPGKR